MKRRLRHRHRFTAARIAAITLVVLVGHRLLYPLPAPSRFQFDSPQRRAVRRVIDGDTIELEGGVRVRLLGVDTPETNHPDRPPERFGREATEFTRQFVDDRIVRLEFDRERHDNYRRVLAWVYVDDVLVNEEIVRAGWGRAMTRFPCSAIIRKRLLAAQSEAREAGRGIWQD